MNFSRSIVRSTITVFTAITMIATSTGAQVTPTRSGKPTEPTVVRVYDIHELITPAYEFPLATSPYGRTFTNPTGQSASYVGGGGQAIGQDPNNPNALFSGGGKGPSGPDTKALSNELLKLIEDNIAPDTWKDNGGSLGAIHEIKGSLVITQTQANHALIAGLLEELNSDQGGMVRVSADWLLMPSSQVSKLTKPAAAKEKEQAITEVDPAVLKNLPPGTKHFSGQTLSRNGQIVYLVSGLSRSVVVSNIPVVSTGVAAYSTDVSTIGGGLCLEVNPRVNWSFNNALLTLYSTFSDPANIHASAVTFPGATTQPGGINLAPPAGGPQPFSRVVQDMRTTVRVPLGITFIAGTMTLNPQTQDTDEQQLVLIVKVTASK
jgi:hypothetical protein